MKTYLAVQTDRNGMLTSSFPQEWNFFKLNAERTFYENVKGGDRGWGVEKAKLYGETVAPKRFVFSTNLNSLRKRVAKKEFEARHGTKNKASFDYACPSCGWRFNAPDPIGCSEYNSFNEDSTDRITCFCGKVFGVEHVNTITTVSTTYELK